jgi:enamine deaminase RidA (YjgF/YER057c/UK114 family)
MEMKKEPINPASMWPPMGYSTALKVGNAIYISGLVPVDKSGATLAGGDIKEQSLICFRQIELCTKEAGGTRDNIVKIVAYLRNMADYPGYKEAREEFFANLVPPASVAVEINELYKRDWLVEIEATAVL